MITGDSAGGGRLYPNLVLSVAADVAFVMDALSTSWPPLVKIHGPATLQILILTQVDVSPLTLL